MTSEQKHALQILESIIRPMAKSSRGTALLCSMTPREEYKGWTNENFCRGWAFSVGAHFAEALDIVLQQRKRNKKAYYVWTQGSAFTFQAGYTLHRADGMQAITVLDARDTVPARDGIRRDPGFVRLLLHSRSTEAGTWKEEGQMSMTQDAFVYLLITGGMQESCPDSGA